MTTARELIERGDEWKDKAARLVLPILLERAIENREITYKELCNELQRRHKYPLHWRNCRFPAGKIGDAFIALSKEWNEEVPPLNAILVNAKTGLPGHGADYYLHKFVKKDKAGKLKASDLRVLAKGTIDAVFNYGKHEEVARYFGLRLGRGHVLGGVEPIAAPPRTPFGGGESKAHKTLKAWAASNPDVFEEQGAEKPGAIEFWLQSGDEIDVLFQGKKGWLGLEVKTADAPESEVWRGVFQCVKYRATLRAMRKADAEIPRANVILVVDQQPSQRVKALAKRLDVTLMNVALRRK